MMKINKTTVLTALGLLTMTSCGKELFNEEVYNKAVDSQFMIDNVDKEHDWCLTRNDTITIKTKGSTIFGVQVLTTNPYTSTESEIAAEGVCMDYEVQLCYTIPVTHSAIYIAALDEKGNYLGVVPTVYGRKEIEIALPDLQTSGTLTPPTYQTFTYLYDSNFPLPGDYDYNDMVLRISKSMPDPDVSITVDLNVTLEACGAQELYGAAIHLGGIDYDDIAKVEIVGGHPMDEGYPLQRLYIDSNDVLLRARNGEAVINLFESAQWALGRRKNELGDIDKIHYNVTHGDREGYSATVNPVHATYRITFKKRDKARSLTFDRIDPFIVHQNLNGGMWEVHTYAYKFEESLRELYYGNQSAYDNHISWALIIPKGDFRYPSEGMSLCTFQSDLNATFGPYEGFADWMKNHNTNRSWYLNLTRPQLVY